MKKFNRLIALSVLLYMLAALWTAGISYKEPADRKKEYKVEINRIYNSLSEGEPLDKLDLHSYKYVRGVSFLWKIWTARISHRNSTGEMMPAKRKSGPCIRRTV